MLLAAIAASAPAALVEDEEERPLLLKPFELALVGALPVGWLQPVLLLLLVMVPAAGFWILKGDDSAYWMVMFDTE